MRILFNIFKIFILIGGCALLPKLNAQIDINSKEYVEWVGTCETEVVEKAQLDGLASLTTLERIQYYIDTRRCKYKQQSKLVHAQVDEKQLKEDAQNAKKFKGKDGNIINIIDQRVEKLTPFFFSYTLSKSSLATLTKTSAMKLAPNIRVNCIAPSLTWLQAAYGAIYVAMRGICSRHT